METFSTYLGGILPAVQNNALHPKTHYRPYNHDASQKGFFRRFANVLRDPLTWTSTIYMIVKLPLGILSFTLALVLPVVSIAVTALPLVYLVNLFVNLILLKSGIQSSGEIIPYFIEVHGQFDLVMFARSFIGVPIGLALWFATRSLLNGLAILSGEIARALLSQDEAYTIPQPDQFYTSPMTQEKSHLYTAREG